MLEDLAAFVGKEDQFDDITMLNFTYLGPEKAVSNVKTLTLEAKVENLEQVLGFIGQNLEEAGASVRTVNQILIAAEELWLDVDLIRLEDISQKEFKKSQYVLSAVVRSE